MEKEFGSENKKNNVHNLELFSFFDRIFLEIKQNFYNLAEELLKEESFSFLIRTILVFVEGV